LGSSAIPLPKPRRIVPNPAAFVRQAEDLNPRWTARIQAL